MADNHSSAAARKIAQAERELEELMQKEIAEQEDQEGFEEENEPAPKPQKAPVKQEEVPEDEELSAEEKSFKKRYGDLRRFSQQKEKDYQDKIAKLEARVKDSPVGGPPPKTEAEVAAWVAKYPDVAAIVESLADKRAKERDSDLNDRLTQVEQMREDLAKERAEQELQALHPDFDQIRDTDEFHTWAEDQPKWVQNALYEDTDVKAAARAIDLYKMDKGIKRTTPDRNAALSVSTRNRVTPQDRNDDSWFSESQIQKMSDKEFTEKSEAIEKAMREGKFKYDISQRTR